MNEPMLVDVPVITTQSCDFSGDVKPAKVENFGRTAQLHIEKIIQINPSSVLDVGMGAGGHLLAMQNMGVINIQGVELAEDGVNLARKRFQRYGTLENTTFYHGNILEFSLSKVDAVSIHQVLHCIPYAKAIVHKILETDASLIVITNLRNTLRTRFLARIINRITLLLRGFRFWVHDFHDIDAIIKKYGYVNSFSQISKVWETRVYTK